MKRVVRPGEPAALTAFRDAHPHATWEEARDEHVNEPVFDALSAAQGGLCAYCEIDVRRPALGQVEHVRAKSRSAGEPNLHLDFANMIVGCEGGARPDLDTPAVKRTLRPIKTTLHCGQLKDDDDFEGRVLDPTRDVPASPSVWRFTFAGEMTVDEARCGDAGVDEQLARTTIDALGLDRGGLRVLRRAVLEELDEHLLDIVDPAADAEAWDDARRRVAEAQLLPVEGALQPFWSTIRDWGGSAVEPFLREHADEIPGLGA